jgi:hypothetical protein
VFPAHTENSGTAVLRHPDPNGTLSSFYVLLPFFMFCSLSLCSCSVHYPSVHVLFTIPLSMVCPLSIRSCVSSLSLCSCYVLCPSVHVLFTSPLFILQYVLCPSVHVLFTIPLLMLCSLSIRSCSLQKPLCSCCFLCPSVPVVFKCT